MLQELQTSQNRMQGQLPQSQEVAARAASSSQQNPPGFGDTTQKCCPNVASGSTSDRDNGDKDDTESSLVKAGNQGFTEVLVTADPHEQRQHQSQAVHLSETSMQENPTLHAAPGQQASAADPCTSAADLHTSAADLCTSAADPQTSAADPQTSAADLQIPAAVPVQEKEGEPAVVDAAAAAASCLGKGASGVLLIDDCDDLDFELAQQMEDAARAAKDTQHAQQAVHAQHDADSQPKGGPSSAAIQNDQPPTQAMDQTAMQTTLYMTGATKQPVCPAGDAQAADATASQQPTAQPSTFIGTSVFQDNDMVIDDDLAQLLDAASALRPAGPPDTALAGPGPASSCFSQCDSSKTSPRPRPTSEPRPLPASRSSSPALLHQAAHTQGNNPLKQADRAPGVTTSVNQALRTGGHQLSDITSPAREADGDMLAMEPAGPADLTENHVRWAIVCCYRTYSCLAFEVPS